MEMKTSIGPPGAACDGGAGARVGGDEGAGGASGGGGGGHVQGAERGKHAVGVCDDEAGARGGGDEGAGRYLMGLGRYRRTWSRSANNK